MQVCEVDGLFTNWLKSQIVMNKVKNFKLFNELIYYIMWIDL